MKIVQGDQVQEVVRRFQHRQGQFIHRKLMAGERGSPGNFLLELVRTTSDFFSPRHKHNFDQFRYQVEGEFDFDRNGKMKPGIIGYFPEGTPYGPQSSAVVAVTLVLQFGGASGSGYLLPREVKAGMEVLKAFGEFKDGIFHRNDDVPGRRNAEAYQAIWEHVHGRAMVYPKGRYDAPIYADAKSYNWAPVKGAKGVSEKLFGVWTERRTEAGMLKLEAGASHKVAGRGVYLVMSGTGQCEGKPLQKYTSVFLETGETATLSATEPMELLHYGLPDLSDIEASLHTSGVAMQAAE